MLLTDGMFERDAEAVDLPALLHSTEALHPSEVVRTATQGGEARLP